MDRHEYLMRFDILRNYGMIAPGTYNDDMSLEELTLMYNGLMKVLISQNKRIVQGI